MLAAARIAILNLPFPTIGRIASVRPGARRAPAASAERLERVRWAVTACARRVPFRALCFEQGLAAQVMLRRRGIRSTLYYGAKLDANRTLVAHVWVCHGNVGVIGADTRDGFNTLASFPAEAGCEA